MAIFQLIQDIHRKQFSSTWTLQEKGNFDKVFFSIFEIFEHPFLSEHFYKSIFGGIFSPVVGCRLWL